MIHELLRASHSRSPTTREKAPTTSELVVGAFSSLFLYHYIIPMPGAPIPAGAAGAASLISATRLSVVRSVDATLVAF